MATITATADPTYTPPRVNVQLSGWTTNGPVTVRRVRADGSTSGVWLPDVSGGVSQAYDYWCPTGGEAYRYEAYDGPTTIASPLVTVSDSRAWLILAGIPEQSMLITPTRVPAIEQDRMDGVMRSAFRASPAVEFGPLAPGGMDLQLRTPSEAQRQALVTMLTISPLALLRMPRTELAWQWVYARRIARAPVVPHRRSATAATNTVADHREWSISCLLMDPPDPEAYGDPSASFQLLLDSGMTFQQLLDWKGVGATTFLQVLQGGW